MDEHKFDEKGNLIFPKPEPEKYRILSEKYHWKMQTLEHISWEVEKKHYDNFNSVNQTKRQEILTAWNGTGKTIGEVAVIFNVPTDVVADIILFNIKEYSYLGEKSI